MNIQPQSLLYLCDTPLNNDYENQLTFADVNSQNTYFNSKIKFSFSEYTYIRKDNVIVVGKPIDEIIGCNYLFYKNVGFTNKIYYCFITNMRYLSEDSTEISIETDVFQTFMFDITYNDCFVDREHVNDDTRGKHTYPEDVETGPYICNQHVIDDSMNEISELCYILSSSMTYLDDIVNDKGIPNGGGVYNGIYSGTRYYRFDSASDVLNVLKIYDNHGQSDSINGLFMAPKILAPLNTEHTQEQMVNFSHEASTYLLPISNQSSLNGYIPKNNKLLCYPYNYLIASNNTGNSCVYEYENFTVNPGFKVYMALTPGCSIKLVPMNYRGIDENPEYSINMGKLPICSYQNDMYTNWLTQNSINILGQNVSSDELNLGFSAMSALGDYLNAFGKLNNMTDKNFKGNILGAASDVLSGYQSIASALVSKSRHEHIPAQTSGNLNSGDINTSSNSNCFHFYKMSIKQEYAKIIDSYFSMYGYKVATVKKPNITGRQNWNYIKTIGSNITGNIPQIYIDKINAIFNKGITLWHNKDTMFDYSQDNNIV